MVRSTCQVPTCRPTDRKLKIRWNDSNGFHNGWDRKPLDSQRETVGEPFPLGFRGSTGRKKEGGYLKIFPFSSAFFFIAQSANPRERVVRLFLESPAVGLLGLRKFISSRQPLDCWGSAFPGYRQWDCRNSVAISRRVKGALKP